MLKLLSTYWKHCCFGYPLVQQATAINHISEETNIFRWCHSLKSLIWFSLLQTHGYRLLKICQLCALAHLLLINNSCLLSRNYSFYRNGKFCRVTLVSKIISGSEGGGHAVIKIVHWFLSHVCNPKFAAFWCFAARATCKCVFFHQNGCIFYCYA